MGFSGLPVTGTGSHTAPLSGTFFGLGALPPEMENTGSGENFSASLSFSFSADGLVTPPPEITGAGEFTSSLIAAMTGLGGVSDRLTGTGVMSVSLSPTLDASGEVAQPQDISGTGDFQVNLSIDFSAGGAGWLAYTMGMVRYTVMSDLPFVATTPVTDRPIVLPARLRARRNQNVH
jgi:hypothetical protein